MKRKNNRKDPFEKPKNKIRKSQPNRQTPVFAKKSFGQNFLVDRNYIDKIIKALAPTPGETIVEIGPGRGALTERLLKSGAQVAAIELDRDLIPVLREQFKDYENFTLVEGDALKVDFAALNPKSEIRDPKSLKLVANLPYYISTAILQRLIAERTQFSEMILMFQREVVERITAGAGDAERGFLSVLTEAYLTAEKLFDVPPAAFRPAPKIWSAVVRLISKTESQIRIKDDEKFRRLVSAGFAQRRKTISNNFKNLDAEIDVERLLELCAIDPARRAETLQLSEWICLANSLETF